MDKWCLTLNFQLLLKDHPLSLAPFALAFLDLALIDPAHHITKWLKSESKYPFHIRRSIWEHAGFTTKFNEYVNQAMASDAQFVASLLTTNEESTRHIQGEETVNEM